MKNFVIKTNGGYYMEARRFDSISFPMSIFALKEQATQFMLRGMAQRVIKNHKLNRFKAEIEEIEIE